jgi:hypothetical protein
VPYCTACGALRTPLTTRSVNLAGKPSTVGGAVARVIGWLVLIVGVSLALGLGFLAWFLFTVTLALAIGLPIGLIALAVGIALVASGRKLGRTGAQERQMTQEDAVFALAAHRGGVLRAEDAAVALALRLDQGDALLTSMAKRDPDRIAVDLDEQGGISYRFVYLVGPGAGVRVADPKVRVEGATGAQPAEQVGDEVIVSPHDVAARTARR